MADIQTLLKRNPYQEWIVKEGLPIVDDYAIDLFAVETKHWARFDVNAAVVHCRGRGDFASMFLFEIAPGRASAPQHHLYEQVVYILEGHGNTTVEFPGGERRSFEWGERSMFAIPINATYRHFNASGQNRALLVTTTDLPLKMNLFHNEDFIFTDNFDFRRTGKKEYFDGGGDLITSRPGKNTWETNFVPDVMQIQLKAWEDRGAGSSNIMFVLADGIMHAHLSEMPVGTYKKAHRHGPGFHVMCVGGEGFSLFWFEGEKEYLRIDWKHGIVFPPAERQIHQHFNTSDRPARYLATGVGSVRYPLQEWQRRAGGDPTVDGKKGAVSLSMKEGGDQIEYEDQDPEIHPMWLADLKKNNVRSKMTMFD